MDGRPAGGQEREWIISAGDDHEDAGTTTVHLEGRRIEREARYRQWRPPLDSTNLVSPSLARASVTTMVPGCSPSTMADMSAMRRSP